MRFGLCIRLRSATGRGAGGTSVRKRASHAAGTFHTTVGFEAEAKAEAMFTVWCWWERSRGAAERWARAVTCAGVRGAAEAAVSARVDARVEGRRWPFLASTQQHVVGVAWHSAAGRLEAAMPLRLRHC